MRRPLGFGLDVLEPPSPGSGTGRPARPARLGLLVMSLIAGPLAAPAQGAAAQDVPVQDALRKVAPEAVGLSAAGLAEVTAVLSAAVEEEAIVGAVAGVVRRGQLAYLEAVGVQDLATRAPMTDASLFRIYSMTKPVTSVAAMILWQEGRFDLDDPVSRFLPEFADVMVLESESGPLRPPAGPITVRDLMLHTSGLSHRTSSLYRDAQVRRRDIPMSQFIENITSVPLLEDPGTRYRYSEATTVLGALVEIWSGRPFDEFLEERVFGPLGMESTGFWVRPEDRGRLTTAYSGGRGEPQRPVEIEEVPFTVRPELLEGAVGLVSTVPDFLSFSQMLMNRGELGGVRILEPETVDLLTANGLPPEVLAARQGTMGWGLGNVNVVMDPASLSYPAGMGEYGWDGSAGTIFWNDPASDLVIVLMWQNQPANPGSLRQRLKTLVYEALLD